MGELNQDEVTHFIVGKTLANYPIMPESLKSYLTEQNWKDCKSLDYIAELSQLCDSLEQD